MSSTQTHKDIRYLVKALEADDRVRIEPSAGHFAFKVFDAKTGKFVANVPSTLKNRSKLNCEAQIRRHFGELVDSKKAARAAQKKADTAMATAVAERPVSTESSATLDGRRARSEHNKMLVLESVLRMNGPATVSELREDMMAIGAPMSNTTIKKHLDSLILDELVGNSGLQYWPADFVREQSEQVDEAAPLAAPEETGILAGGDGQSASTAFSEPIPFQTMLVNLVETELSRRAAALEAQTAQDMQLLNDRIRELQAENEKLTKKLSTLRAALADED